MSAAKIIFHGLLILMGIYTAIFLVASQNYETRLNVVQHRASRVFYLLNTPGAKQAIEQIPKVQKMKGPVRPVFWSFASLFDSLSGKQTSFPEIAAQLKTILVVYKKTLESYDLSKINLKGSALANANLRSANLNNAKLQDAVLSEADLNGANLSKANLKNVDLAGADLTGVNFRGAKLIGADLSGANMSQADFTEATIKNTSFAQAIFRETDFSQVDLSGADFNQARKRPEHRPSNKFQKFRK